MAKKNTSPKVGTVSITTRLNIVTVAKVAMLLKEKGYNPTTKSDLIWQCMEAFGARIIEEISVKDAITYLDKAGMSVMSNDRQERQCIKALQDEATREDDILPMKRIAESSLSISKRDMYEQAAEFMRKMGRTPISWEEFCANLEATAIKAANGSELVSDESKSSDALNKERTAYDAAQLANMKSALGIPPKPTTSTQSEVETTDKS